MITLWCIKCGLLEIRIPNALICRLSQADDTRPLACRATYRTVQEAHLANKKLISPLAAIFLKLINIWFKLWFKCESAFQFWNYVKRRPIADTASDGVHLSKAGVVPFTILFDLCIAFRNWWSSSSAHLTMPCSLSDEPYSLEARTW